VISLGIGVLGFNTRHIQTVVAVDELACVPKALRRRSAATETQPWRPVRAFYLIVATYKELAPPADMLVRSKAAMEQDHAEAEMPSMKE